MKSNDDFRPVSGLFSAGTLNFLGLLPVAAFFILMGIFKIEDSSTIYEAPVLLAFLNTIFLCIIPLLIAYEAAKSYHSTGILAFLMIGCGLVFFGVSSLYAGWVMPLAGSPNPTVTLHNLGSLFAGIFQFAGAHFFMRELAGVSEKRGRIQKYGIIYAGIFILISITAVLVFQGILPVFFDHFSGPSTGRQFVLSSAVGLFTVTGILFLEMYATTKTKFAYWYGLALLLISIGLTCVLLQSSVGSVLGWAGRGAQYVGSVYFIFAFLQGRQEDFSSTSTTSWALWPYLEHRLQERTAGLVQINEELKKEIAECKQIEASLQESEANLRAVFNATDESIFLISADGTLLALNDFVAQNMRQSREALVGRKLFSLMSADDAAHYRLFIERALVNGEGVFFEDEWNDRWMMYHFYPILNNDGKVVRLAVYSRDITLRKQAEESSRLQGNELEKRVQERTAELVRASRVKDEFLATVSHELRTPLSGILGYSEALLEGMRGPMTEKQEKAVQIIYSSGGHLLGLINDILDISKIESGQFELHPENINVNEICQSSLVFIEQLANKKSMTVEYSIPSIVPVIFADPKRVKQILVNLLSNAVKFTPEGGMVKLEIKPSAEESLVRFSVTDTGIGISPDDLQKLFKPFVQVDSGLSRQYEGSGLGLALVKKMVDLHNGSIEVQSEVGVGSRFTFTLPCSQ